MGSVSNFESLPPQAVIQRIEALELKWLVSGGYIWIPLEVSLDAMIEVMINAFIEQTADVEHVAYNCEVKGNGRIGCISAR